MNFIVEKILNLFSYHKRSVIEFNNIVGIYENFLITQENHFVGGFEIRGVSYMNVSAEEEINLFQLARMNFLKTIKDVDISISPLAKTLLIMKMARLEWEKRNL